MEMSHHRVLSVTLLTNQHWLYLLTSGSLSSINVFRNSNASIIVISALLNFLHFACWRSRQKLKPSGLYSLIDMDTCHLMFGKMTNFRWNDNLTPGLTNPLPSPFHHSIASSPFSQSKIEFMLCRKKYYSTPETALPPMAASVSSWTSSLHILFHSRKWKNIKPQKFTIKNVLFLTLQLVEWLQNLQ